MDPDANIREQRLLKAKIKRGMASGYEKSRLRELQTALREWARRGGFPPQGYHRSARGTFVKNKARKFSGYVGPIKPRNQTIHLNATAKHRAAYCSICRGPHKYKHGKS